MGSTHSTPAVNWREQFSLPPAFARWLRIFLLAGVVLIGIGLLQSLAGGHAHDAEHAHHAAPWLSRLSANLLITSMYLLGISVLSLFFLAVGYAANAGWYVMLQRIPQTFAGLLPLSAILLAGVAIAFPAFCTNGAMPTQWPKTNSSSTKAAT